MNIEILIEFSKKKKIDLTLIELTQNILIETLVK
jgi:hypothetical protein